MNIINLYISASSEWTCPCMEAVHVLAVTVVYRGGGNFVWQVLRKFDKTTWEQMLILSTSIGNL